MKPAASKPIKLRSLDYFLPYQNRWIDDDSPFKIYPKSRRIGITFATSYRCFKKCLARRDFTQWVSSRDLLTAKEFISDYIARWCKLANVAATGLAGDQVEVFDASKDVKAFIADFPITNSRIVSLSSTPEVFAGKGGDVLLDEVDLHEDQGRLIDMAMPVTTWGGQLEAVSAYRVDGSPASVWARLVAEAAAANPMHASLHRTTILDAIDQGFVEKVNAATGRKQTREEFLQQLRAKCRTEAAWQSQYMCNPQDDGGALLPYSLLAQCETDAPELQAHRDPAAPAYLGIDIGRRHDLSCFWLVRRHGLTFWTDKILIFAKTLFRDQLQAAAELLRDPSIIRCCVDSTGIGAMLAEELHLRFGHRVEEIQFTNAVKLELGMPMLQAFEDKAIRIPTSNEIREDLHKVRKTATKAGNIRLEAESDDEGHADRFWALALALHASVNSVAPAPITIFDNHRNRAIAARRSRELVA
ncbi:MAG: hypothetical protein HY343_09655 [Lentisphaerae bacterium]|nr:hypothetical protein [Lentisphaerota bacterium]